MLFDDGFFGGLIIVLLADIASHCRLCQFCQSLSSTVLSNFTLACLFGHRRIHTCICVPPDCYYHVGSDLRFASE